MQVQSPLERLLIGRSRRALLGNSVKLKAFLYNLSSPYANSFVVELVLEASDGQIFSGIE